MAPNLAPPARSGAVREASPPTHAVLRIGLNFKFLLVPGRLANWEQRHQPPRLPAPRSASHHNLGSGSLPAQRCHHPPGSGSRAARAASGCPQSTK